MADVETETEIGATPTIRAINKMRAIAKACVACGMAKNAESATALADALESTKDDKRKALDAALQRRRSTAFEKGQKVKASDAFVSLYGKGMIEVTEIVTVGGDDNGRGGRAWLKGKNDKGLSITGPVSAFELA